MTSTNKRRNIQLGMPFGTANSKLRRIILFDLLKQLGQNICFQCGEKIETIEELSIEHKESWLDKENAKELFWNLDNIAFSHLKCNIRARDIPNKGNLKHPSIFAYQKGCRCLECKELNRQRVAKQRTIGA